MHSLHFSARSRFIFLFITLLAAAPWLHAQLVGGTIAATSFLCLPAAKVIASILA
jgi:hypothetical protein